MTMRDYLMSRRRVVCEAEYCIKHHATIRQIAKEFKISKSTVYKDLTIRLEDIHYPKRLEVYNVIQDNKRQRASKGGKARAEKVRISKLKSKEE